MGKVDLKIDWATYEAAKFACLNWHYSKCVPIGKLVKIGVWEAGVYIGVVIFSTGASPKLHKAFNVTRFEVCELVRVALTKHISQVSRVIALSFKFLKKNSPKLRLIVSFADPDQGHYGCIYQASNWVYIGESTNGIYYQLSNGKITHNRNLQGPKGFGGKSKSNIQSQYTKKLNLGLKSGEIKKIITSPKHKYLMPLDEEMRKQIEPLRKPYPKRPTKATSSDQEESGGAVPTRTLQT
jgi:hypothetical protein